MDVVLVAAVAENGIIGRGNALPWRLRSELRLFRELTWDHPVVMGRKTFLSLGKPLPGRTNIVVTRHIRFTAAGSLVATELPWALTVARGDALRRGKTSIMVIGGGELYAALLPLADRLEITHVHAKPSGDASFPCIEPHSWLVTNEISHARGPQDDAAFTRVSYRRRPIPSVSAGHEAIA